MSCTRTIEDSKPQRREGRQGNDFFRIGTDDSEKIPALRAISAYCRAARPPVSAVPPSATCRVVARRAKPEADRLFSFGHTGARLKRPFNYEDYPLNRYEI